jgi:hypothetical protein
VDACRSDTWTTHLDLQNHVVAPVGEADCAQSVEDVESDVGAGQALQVVLDAGLLPLVEGRGKRDGGVAAVNGRSSSIRARVESGDGVAAVKRKVKLVEMTF